MTRETNYVKFILTPELNWSFKLRNKRPNGLHFSSKQQYVYFLLYFSKYKLNSFKKCKTYQNSHTLPDFTMHKNKMYNVDHRNLLWEHHILNASPKMHQLTNLFILSLLKHQLKMIWCKHTHIWCYGSREGDFYRHTSFFTVLGLSPIF